MKIGVIDYGAGNLHSVCNALAYLDLKAVTIASPRDLDGVDKCILPGVGSFGHAVRRIREAGFYSAVSDWLNRDRPFLGICLGFQMLFESSRESPGENGWGYFKGNCLRFPTGKVPQIGWNAVYTEGPSVLFDGLSSGEHFYFVHSYYVSTVSEGIALGRTEYGRTYVSAAGSGRVFGVQFHPEKSGDAGLRLLENWGKRC